MSFLFKIIGGLVGKTGGRVPPSSLNFMQSFSNARADRSLTDFLVTNPLFRQIAIGFHNKK